MRFFLPLPPFVGNGFKPFLTISLIMKFTRENISLKKINFKNKKYKIVDAYYEDIFFTPILFLSEGEFIILSGHAFLKAERGKEKVWANIVDEKTSLLDCIKISILSQKRIKEFNIVEEALGLNLIKSISNEEECVKNAEEILGAKYNLSIINDIVSILVLDEKIQASILSGLIHFKMGKYLNKFKNDEISCFLNFFESFKLSFSSQKRFLRLVQEIAKIEDISILSCLKPLSDIVSMDLNINKKQEEVFKKLLSQRYPEMTKAQKKIRDSVKKLNLPTFINFKYPLDFEALEFELSFKFKNREELLKKGDTIKDIIELKEWDEVLLKA